MPSTRSAARPSTPIQSQRHAETYDTVSTAALPPSYTVTLASVSNVTEDEIPRQVVRGQEYLHDAVRRVGDKEGDLRDLVHARKKRKLGDVAATTELDKDVLWYTASLRYPCSCDLAPMQKSYTLRRPPPSAVDLSDLTDDLPAPERVRPVSELPDWHDDASGYADIEPELDHLPAFEHGWQGATGSIWAAQLRGSGRFCDAFEYQEEEGVLSFEAIKESLTSRRLRKGKFKAVDTSDSIIIPPFLSDTVDVSSSALSPLHEDMYSTGARESAWEEEAKRRKQLWRGLLGKDPGYGQFWKHLSRPHTYSNFGALLDQRLPPDYNLFRNYRTAAHPFHPDLSYLARRNPGGRVYWLIPLHGPVVVPSLNDGVLEGTPVGAEVDVPMPSSASFSLNPLARQAEKSPRPAPIYWTPRLLNHFVDSFLLPLRQSRLYSVAIACSGPKPDPFIALKPATPLPRHRFVPNANRQPSTPAPVRLEAGDHIRLYCDISEALSLRTWLNGVAIDPTAVGDIEGKSWKLFDRTRLCLVGELGEVLIVA